VPRDDQGMTAKMSLSGKGARPLSWAPVPVLQRYNTGCADINTSIYTF